VNLKNAQIVAEEREKEMTIVNVKTAESEMAEKNKYIAKINNFTLIKYQSQK